jgi:hypothetical protein
MTVSKRLRFEILRRDNHACRYCGATAPEAKLTVDHVVPTALGGADEPANLVAACAACNSGKSSSSPDTPIVADVASDAIRWGSAIQRAADTMLADLERREQGYTKFAERWNSWGGGAIPLPPDWKPTVDSFVAAGLPLPLLLECVDIAMGQPKVRQANIFRYLCGVAWNRVTALQEAAKAQVGPNSDEENPGEYPMLDILDECFARPVVEAAGGDKVMAKLAAQCMWEAASGGHTGWKQGIAAGMDSSDTWDEAREFASNAAAWFLNEIQRRSRGEI